MRDLFNKFIFYILFFFLLFNFSVLHSAIKIEIPDAVIQRGNIQQLPIIGTIDSGISNLKIILKFNSRVIDIKKANGGSASAMKCQSPAIDFNFDNLDSSFVSISCDSIQSLTNDTICTIDVEGLVGKDTITDLTPVQVFLNGIETKTFDYRKGTVRVPGSPIELKQSEYLGNSYPNPSWGDIFFPFNLTKKSKIKFIVYDLNGSVVSISTDKTDYFHAFYNNEFRNISEVTELDKGSYLLKYTPGIDVSCGNYFLVMITDNNIFNNGFIINK